MNCPECGKFQTAPLQCQSCGGDLRKVSNKSLELNIYRVAVVVLFALTLWLGYETRPQNDFPSNLANANNKDSSALNLEKSPPSSVDVRNELKTTRTRDQNLRPANLIYQADYLLDISIADEFQQQYQGKTSFFNLGQVEQITFDTEENPKPIYIGIGQPAQEIILNNPSFRPAFLVGLDSNLGDNLSVEDQIFGVSPQLPIELEMNLVRKIFPRTKNWILVTDSRNRSIPNSILEEWNINLNRSTPNSEALADTLSPLLNNTNSTDTLIFFYQVPSDTVSNLLLSLRENFPDGTPEVMTVAGLLPDAIDRIDEYISDQARPNASLTHPIIQLRLSPERLANQLSSLISQYSLGTEMSVNQFISLPSVEFYVSTKQFSQNFPEESSVTLGRSIHQQNASYRFIP